MSEQGPSEMARRLKRIVDEAFMANRSMLAHPDSLAILFDRELAKSVRIPAETLDQAETAMEVSVSALETLDENVFGSGWAGDEKWWIRDEIRDKVSAALSNLRAARSEKSR